MENETDVPGPAKCPEEVTRASLTRLLDGEEPGRGFTVESLREHVEACVACQASISYINQRNSRLSGQFDAFRQRISKIVADTSSQRTVENEKYAAHRRAAEQLRRNLVRLNELPEQEQAATLMDLGLVDTKSALKQLVRKQPGGAVVKQVVTALQSMHKMNDTERRALWFETLGMWCKDVLRQIPDPEKKLGNLSGGREPTHSIPLDRPEAVTIALAVASDTEVIQHSREPILNVRAGNPETLVYNREVYNTAVAASGR